MTWDSDLMRLRSVLGDVSPLSQIFEDDYLEAMLDEYGAVGNAAVAALERLQNDPDMIRQKYAGLGKFGVSEIVALRRSVGEQIQSIKEGPLMSSASSADTRFPSSDLETLGGSTDDSGWNVESDVQIYQSALDSKLT